MWLCALWSLCKSYPYPFFVCFWLKQGIFDDMPQNESLPLEKTIALLHINKLSKIKFISQQEALKARDVIITSRRLESPNLSCTLNNPLFIIRHYLRSRATWMWLTTYYNTTLPSLTQTMRCMIRSLRCKPIWLWKINKQCIVRSLVKQALSL